MWGKCYKQYCLVGLLPRLLLSSLQPERHPVQEENGHPNRARNVRDFELQAGQDFLQMAATNICPD